MMKHIATVALGLALLGAAVPGAAHAAGGSHSAIAACTCSTTVSSSGSRDAQVFVRSTARASTCTGVSGRDLNVTYLGWPVDVRGILTCSATVKSTTRQHHRPTRPHPHIRLPG